MNDKGIAAVPAVAPEAPPEAEAKKTELVYKPDGTRQCESRIATDLNSMEKELKGIQVIARKKDNDGKMRIQVCGQPTGAINVFEIPKERLSDALTRGFKLLIKK